MFENKLIIPKLSLCKQQKKKKKKNKDLVKENPYI